MNEPSKCFCNQEDCDFLNKFKNKIPNSQNFCYSINPKSKNLQQILHILIAGIRILHIDLIQGTSNEIKRSLELITEAVDIFESKSTFNIPITKVCTIRGRQPRVGRMRNNAPCKLYPFKKITLTCDERYKYCCSDQVVYIYNFQCYIPLLKIEDVIIIDGNRIHLQVIKIVQGTHVTCCVTKHNKLRSFQEVTMPFRIEESLLPTDNDLEDCLDAVNFKFNFLVVPKVKSPEYYHILSKILKTNQNEDHHVKLLAEVDADDFSNIDQIIEHFYGIWISPGCKGDLKMEEYISNKCRELKKPLILEFTKERSPGNRTIRNIVTADCFFMESKCPDDIKIIQRADTTLRRITNEILKYQDLNDDNEPIEVKLLDVCSSLIAKLQKAKVVICITNSGASAIHLSQLRLKSRIIALTKKADVAARLNLWKNVKPMVYVNCDSKSWIDQVNEMVQIALKYGTHVGLIKTGDIIISCFNSTGNSEDINNMKLNYVE